MGPIRLLDRADRALDRLRRPSRAVMVVIAVAIFVISWKYFFFSATHAGRDLSPKLHDEFMYLLQARMLAHGRLWMPQHPLADFFQSFHIITRPVYAATYFPGAALFYVPGMWLGLNAWVTSIAIAAGIVTLAYVVITLMADGVLGLLAALLLASLEELRTIAVSAMSHSAMTLLALLLLVSYLAWRKRRTIPRAVWIGVFAGWGAITRPLDAACVALPIGVAILWDLFHSSRANRSRLATFMPVIGVIVAGALPFLALQLIFDRGVTGSWFTTPIAAYDRATFPGLSLGFTHHAVPAPPTDVLPQIRDYYNSFIKPELLAFQQVGFIHTWIMDRFAVAMTGSVPYAWLLVLVPIGVLGLRTPPRIALASWVITLPLAYSFFPFFLRHYGLVVAPAVISMIVLAVEFTGRWSRGARSVLSVALVVVAIVSLPEVRRKPDRFMETAYLDEIDRVLDQLDHTPAVVLFRYTGQTDVHEEPVYNIKTAWPDDAPVIRAQDLGPEDWQIFKYYAGRRPRRYFYAFDRAKLVLIPLGWDIDLAKEYPGPPGRR